MNSFLPRASFLIPFLATVALAGTACGGRFVGGPNPEGDDGGSSSSSGGSSGGSSSGSGSSSGIGSSSSSGGGSGSSSGISSSSSSGGGSGSSSGGSSSSSGGGVCPPVPGEGPCSYGEQCGYGTGCGAEDCSCDSSGNWQCVTPVCPPPECPPGAPSSGTSCEYEGQSCGYGSNGGGCGETCECNAFFGGTDAGSLEWQCYADPCPPPVCPPTAPNEGTACSSIGSYCYYPDDAGVCTGETCQCDPSGIWSCSFGDFCDAGAPPPDAGWQE
jgi:hypothetical protein